MAWADDSPSPPKQARLTACHNGSLGAILFSELNTRDPATIPGDALGTTTHGAHLTKRDVRRVFFISWLGGHMKKKINKGKPLNELVKGSLDYTMSTIRRAFYRQFPDSNWETLWVREVFADHLIVSTDSLPEDEFYYVAFTMGEGGGVVFPPRDQWLLVELTYQIKPRDIAEAQKKRSLSDSRPRLVETIVGSMKFLEQEQEQNSEGPWRITAVGTSANVINGNNRLYPAAVLSAAVEDAREVLSQSLGQGRLILSGEADHPNDKGNKKPLLTETIINWDKIEFDGSVVKLEGWLFGSSKGKDVRAQMKGGLRPDVSQRAYGESQIVSIDGRSVEQVSWLVITGYDLVTDGSDPVAAVTYFESKQENSAMNLKDEILKLLKENPQLFSEAIASQVALATGPELDKLYEQVKTQLGLGTGADLGKALAEAVQAKKKLDQMEQEQAIAKAIEEATKDLPYGEKLNKAFVEAVKAAGATSPEAVAALVKSKRLEYDAIASAGRVSGMGYDVKVTGPVFEAQTGVPEFAEASYRFTNELANRGLSHGRDLRKLDTPNGRFARQYLESFDKAYRSQLMAEARQLKEWQEAESTSDLNLPYSLSRAIIAEAVPELVALSVFDFGLVEGSPTRIYFESYAPETGAVVTITSEDTTAALNGWVSLAHKRLVPGTVTITNAAASVTYVENADYVLDYANGRYYALATITNGQALKANYQYNSVREGESAAIQRGKGTLSYQDVTLVADRLATEITDEAIAFSRSQLGWDAQTKTISMLIREIREMIDAGIFRLGIASAIISGNNGGTWATSDPITQLVEKIGVALTAVEKDNYMPAGIVLSLTNADRLGNWDGFKRDGFPNAVMDSAGYIGSIKGKPVFRSNQMPDSIVLVGHRELVQQRVLSSRPMTLKGPFPSYSSNKLVAAEQWYVEEYNTTVSLIPSKGGYVKVS